MLTELYKAIDDPARFTITEGQHSNIYAKVHYCKTFQIEAYKKGVGDEYQIFSVRYLPRSSTVDMHSMVIGYINENKVYSQYNVNGEDLEEVLIHLEDKFGVMIRE